MRSVEALVRRYYDDLWNRWRTDVASEVLAPDVHFRGSLGVEGVGIEALLSYLESVRTAFPDFHNRIESLVCEEEKAAARMTWTGTHRGPLQGVAATNLPIRYEGAADFDVREGRIARVHAVGDTLALFRQIGAVGAPGEPCVGLSTTCAHAGADPDGGLTIPIHQTSTWRLSSAEEGARFSHSVGPERFYTRWGNPTAQALQDAIASLEGSEAGLAFASGVAAVSSAVLATVNGGDHVAAAQCAYTATTELFARVLPQYGVDATFFDAADPAALQRALRPNTRLVFLETPANPRLDVTDLRAVAAIAGAHGAFTICDNTVATPWNQRPIEHGIDAVVHSATKGLGGHSDVIAGLVAGPREWTDRVWKTLKVMGGCLGPFDAWLVLRGIRTLPLRTERQNATALALARFLEGHSHVERAHYPGLGSHPGHEVAVRQMRGFGCLLAFEVKGGVEAGRRFLESLRLVRHAVSLGGTESLATHPASTTHAPLSPEERRRSGIGDGLVRMSVGLEPAGDVIADVERALA